jgi:acyl-CoA reductase-like NAD-dependent aldehyde dehydrogenase
MYKVNSIINGKIVEGKEFYNVISPFNNKIIGKVTIPTDEMIEEAIKSSQKNFYQYKKSYSFKRKEKFQNLINLVEKNHEKLSKIITLEYFDSTIFNNIALISKLISTP